MPVWSIVLLVIIAILVVALIALIIVGNKLRKKQTENQAQIDAATKERTALAATLPTDVLTDYERLLKQFRGLAVETIKGNIPTICHTALQASSMSDLNHDGSEIAHCPYCHRLLVLPSKEA